MRRASESKDPYPFQECTDWLRLLNRQSSIDNRQCICLSYFCVRGLPRAQPRGVLCDKSPGSPLRQIPGYYNVRMADTKPIRLTEHVKAAG